MCCGAEVSDVGCHSVSLRFTQDQSEVYKESFIWNILVFSQEQLVCVTFFTLLFSKLTFINYFMH